MVAYGCFWIPQECGEEVVGFQAGKCRCGVGDSGVQPIKSNGGIAYRTLLRHDVNSMPKVKFKFKCMLKNHS